MTKFTLTLAAAVLIGAASFLPANAADINWTGSDANGDWNSSGNWDSAAAPTSADEVTISTNPDGISLDTTPAIIKYLQLSDGTLTVTTGLTATGSASAPTTPNTNAATHRNAIVVNNGATLDLQSGANVTVAANPDATVFLRVGYNDLAGGTLNVADGATLNVGASTRYANFHIGETAGASGFVNQTGGNVNVLGSLNIGVDGGSGIYSISGGTLHLDHADDAGHTSLITLGLNLNPAGGPEFSTGSLNLSGTGRVELTTHDIGGGVQGSTQFILGNRARGAASYGNGDGIINQSGGTFSVTGDAILFLSSVGNGLYNLSGGTLEVGGSGLQANYGNGGGAYQFNFGGTPSATPATIKVVGTNLNTAVNVNLVSGISVVDTNGLDATLSGNITSDGIHQQDFGGNAFVKANAGTLNLTGTSRGFDSAYVTGGSINQTAGSTTAVEFGVGSGSGATGNFTLNGGSLTINASQNLSAAPVAGSFRVGDFGGTGTFTQNAGTVTVTTNGALNIGNQGGTGTYNLNGGTLTLAGGLNTIGRSTGANPASNGTLNIAGGTLSIESSSSLINGNNIVGGATGTSTINQTGGTVSVAAGSHLYVSGYGAGTYNLSGGTLQAGGDSIQARYNNTTSSYAFNIGSASSAAAATVQVTGSDLTTNAAATLIGTNAVVNTNGFNANFTGGFTGSGNLSKTGTGNLTTTSIAANQVSVNGGQLTVTSSLSASTLVVNNGGQFNANLASVDAATLIQSGGKLALRAGQTNFTQGLALAGGSTVVWTLDGNTSTDTLKFSAANVSGVTLVSGTATIDVNFTNNVNFGDAFWQQNHSWNLITDVTGDPSGLVSSLNLTHNGSFTVDQGQFALTGTTGPGGSVQLEWTAIPEPSTYGFLGAGLLVFIAGIRRKNNKKS